MQLKHLKLTRSVVFVIGLALGSATAQAQSPKYVAKIGHLEAATQPRHKALEKVAQLVKERTNGEVEFKLYPSSQLGNARQMVEGVQFGSIEATVMPAAFLGGFDPAVSILDIPYLYPTDHAKSQKLREGPFGKALLKSFSTKGLVALTIWPNGRKDMTSNRPLESIDAYRGQKFRVMDSKILVEQFAALGASAIPIPFGELYTALQTGIVDGEENPPDTITTMKFDEVQKYLVVTDHGAMEDIVLFNPKWWASLPESHRKAIAKSFDDVRPEMEAMKDRAQADALEQIIKSGTTSVRRADEAERAKMRDLMYPRSRAAYIDRAGPEGKRLIELYEAEYKKL
jgi:tripartite ATP-independent transporter DctP family solute receptor